jgi:hypothetical protein
MSEVRRAATCLAATVLAGGLGRAGDPAQPKPGQPPLSIEAPPAVRESVERAVPGIQDLSVRKGSRKTGVRMGPNGEKTPDERDVYEVRGRISAGPVMLTVASDGEVVRKSEELAVAALPQPIKALTEGAVRPVDFAVRKVRRMTEKGSDVYEVEAVAGELNYRIRISAAGQVLDLIGTRSALKPGENERRKEDGPEIRKPKPDKFDPKPGGPKDAAGNKLPTEEWR